MLKPIGRTAAGLAFLALAGAAMGQETNRNDTVQAPPGQTRTEQSGQARAGQTQGDPAAQSGMFDQHFLMAAAANDVAEISTGQMASTRASRDEVKQYAQMMVQDHSRASQQLKQIAAARQVQLPQRPDVKDQACASHLATLQGEAFDQAYMKGQVLGHMLAVDLFQGAAQHAKDEQIRAFASQTLPVLQKHLQHAQQLAGGSEAGAVRQTLGRPAAGESTTPTDANPTPRPSSTDRPAATSDSAAPRTTPQP